MKRSKFSLSNEKLFSCNMGSLVPMGLTEVLPGDSIQQSTSTLCMTGDTRGAAVSFPDVPAGKLTAHLRWLADSDAETFARLVKALSDGNSAVESTILRRWGIRR